MTFSKQLGIKLWCIKNKEKEYWSNENGWLKLYIKTKILDYTIFTEQEKNKFNLPMGNKVHWELI